MHTPHGPQANPHHGPPPGPESSPESNAQPAAQSEPPLGPKQTIPSRLMKLSNGKVCRHKVA